jgi:hypothetical protein
LSTLKDILARVENWPMDGQEQLAEIILEIDAEVRSGHHKVSHDELRTIDDADRSGVATEEGVAAAFRSFRPSS